jgi:hypothetical protein
LDTSTDWSIDPALDAAVGVEEAAVEAAAAGVVSQLSLLIRFHLDDSTLTAVSQGGGARLR